MKLIRKGRNPLEPTWLGRHIDCENCKGCYELEAGDRVQQVSDQRDGDYYKVRCPNCGNTMTIQANE